MTTGLGPTSKLKRGSSNGNSLCGGNSPGSREICATFQRDNLRRHRYSVVLDPEPSSNCQQPRSLIWRIELVAVRHGHLHRGTRPPRHCPTSRLCIGFPTATSLVLGIYERATPCRPAMDRSGHPHPDGPHLLIGMARKVCREAYRLCSFFFHVEPVASWRVVDGGVQLEPYRNGSCPAWQTFRRRRPWLCMSAMQNHNGRGGEDCAARK